MRMLRGEGLGLEAKGRDLRREWGRGVGMATEGNGRGSCGLHRTMLGQPQCWDQLRLSQGPAAAPIHTSGRTEQGRGRGSLLSGASILHSASFGSVRGWVWALRLGGQSPRRQSLSSPSQGLSQARDVLKPHLAQGRKHSGGAPCEADMLLRFRLRSLWQALGKCAHFLAHPSPELPSFWSPLSAPLWSLH